MNVPFRSYEKSINKRFSCIFELSFHEIIIFIFLSSALFLSLSQSIWISCLCSLPLSIILAPLSPTLLNSCREIVYWTWKQVNYIRFEYNGFSDKTDITSIPIWDIVSFSSWFHFLCLFRDLNKSNGLPQVLSVEMCGGWSKGTSKRSRAKKGSRCKVAIRKGKEAGWAENGKASLFYQALCYEHTALFVVSMNI